MLLAVSITETVLEVIIRDIDVFPIRGDGDRNGVSPHRDRGRLHRVGGRVDHRNSVGATIRDIGVFAIRGDGDPTGNTPTAIVAASTVLVAVSITETVLESSFVT